MSSEPSYRALLPITIVPGTRVHNWVDESAGTVVGVCRDYCICQLDQSEDLWVGNWRDLAVGGLCPARQLLPADVTENDLRNASAVLLKELLNVRQFGWSDTQTVLHEELVESLCRGR